MRPALARQSNPASSRAAAPPPAVSLPVSDNLGRELHGKLVTALAVERSCDAAATNARWGTPVAVALAGQRSDLVPKAIVSAAQSA